MKNKILIVTGLAVIVGGLTWFIWPHSDQPDNIKNDPVATTTTTTLTNSTVASTSTYYIPEMGVRFEYPEHATVTVNILNGTTGNMLSGTINLTPEKVVRFGGMTEDFTWPKGCETTCTTGYTKVGDKYYYGKRMQEDSFINVSRSIYLKDGTSKVIILAEDASVLPNRIMDAIINTKNPRFPGIAFSGSAKTPEDRALFESIVRSIVLE